MVGTAPCAVSAPGGRNVPAALPSGTSQRDVPTRTPRDPNAVALFHGWNIHARRTHCLTIGLGGRLERFGKLRKVCEWRSHKTLIGQLWARVGTPFSRAEGRKAEPAGRWRVHFWSDRMCKMDRI